MKINYLIINLSIIVFLPTFGLMFGSSSMANGIIISSIYSCLLAYSGGIDKFSLNNIKKVFIWAVIISSFMIFSLFQGGYIYSGIDYMKGFLSIPIFILMLYGSLYFYIYLSKRKDSDIHYALITFFYIMCFFAVISVIGISPFYDKQKTVFIFSEPSQYALSYFPFFLYAVFSSDAKKKFLYISITVLIAVLLQSFTLLIVAFVVLLIVLSIQFIVPFTLLILYLPKLVDLEYYTSRMEISADTPNASSLVFASGFERAYLAFIESFPLCVGYQQMGVVGPNGIYMDILNQMNLWGLNSFDGGSTASKIIYEFGTFGVLFIFIYLIYFLRIYKILRYQPSLIKLDGDHFRLFRICCFFAFILSLFVRGSGYFSITTFLFLLSLIEINSDVNYYRSKILVHSTIAFL